MDGYVRIRQRSYRDDGRVLVRLTVGNASGSEDVEFLILEELFAEIDGEISDKDVDLWVVGRLEELSGVTAAYSSACASLAFTQCSSRALLRKLLIKGFPRDS